MYSISGHVAVTLRTSTLRMSQRPSLYQLQSVSVCFEGQAELITDDTGYAASRLFTTTEELVHHAYELDENGEWLVPFDLRLPGWLPASSIFGDSSKDAPGITYALYATAKLYAPGSSTSWLSLCAPSLFASSKILEAPRCEVSVNRYAIPPSRDGTWPLTSFGITPLPRNQQPDQATESARIPVEIFEKMEVIVSIPQRISADQTSFPLTLRIRAPTMPGDIATRLRIPEFIVMLDQTERYR
jgi:hypothetical protein